MGPFDLNSALGRLEAFLRLRGDISGETDRYTWFTGGVYIVFPDKAPQLILTGEGFAAIRISRNGGGYDQLVREMMVYKDPTSGEILTQWENPFTGEVNEVIPVQNDPVNVRHTPDNLEIPCEWIVTEHDVMAKMDFPLAYPNPLSPEDYPEESSGPIYTGSEHFVFQAKQQDFENPNLRCVPNTLSWFRYGPVLPWMRMGQTNARLTYCFVGSMLDGGFESLPVHIQEYTQAHLPQFKNAPDTFTSPNVTSWTFYKRYIDEKRKGR